MNSVERGLAGETHHGGSAGWEPGPGTALRDCRFSSKGQPEIDSVSLSGPSISPPQRGSVVRTTATSKAGEFRPRSAASARGTPGHAEWQDVQPLAGCSRLMQGNQPPL